MLIVFLSTTGLFWRWCTVYIHFGGKTGTVMATFDKRDSGWTQARIRRTGYPEQSKTFEKKSDAEAWARMVESEMDRGVFVSKREAAKWTLHLALERYKDDVTVNKKGKAQEEYRIAYLQTLPLAKKTLTNISDADIDKLMSEELARGLSISSVLKLLSLVSHLFFTAHKKWKLGVSNPCDLVTRPKVNNRRKRRLSKDEARYLMNALDDPGPSIRIETGNKESAGKVKWKVKPATGDRRNDQTPGIVRWAIETAMRQGEILALDWRYVDLENQTAFLPDTKNGQARTVPLSKAAVTIIQPPDNTRPPVQGRVFPTTASAIKQSFVRAVARGRRNYLKDCNVSGIEPTPRSACTHTCEGTEGPEPQKPPTETGLEPPAPPLADPDAPPQTPKTPNSEGQTRQLPPELQGGQWGLAVARRIFRPADLEAGLHLTRQPQPSIHISCG
jgi:integrase